MEFRIVWDKSDLKSLSAIVKEFNKHFAMAEKIILTINVGVVNHAALYYFFTHISTTWDAFKSKVIIDCTSPEQVLMQAADVFDHKHELAFKTKVVLCYIAGTLIVCSTCAGFGYRWFNQRVIRPIIQQQQENVTIKADMMPLISYCLTNGWPTNHVDFFEIVKQTRIAARIYDVPRTAIYAIIAQESEFYRYAVHTNSDGSVDRGLCQIDTCWNGMLIEDNVKVEDNIIYVLEYNIRACASILKGTLKASNGDILYALKRYNTCPDLTYSDQVINRYFILTKMFDR